MSYKMMSPNTTIWWVPQSGLTTPASPKASEINAGVNISAAIETGFKLNAMDSEVDSSRSIVDEGNVKTPTIGNYEADLNLFRDAIGTGTNDAPVPSTVYTTAFNLFKNGHVTGWLVSRQGQKATAACAAGDIVSAFLVTNDYIEVLDGANNAPIRTHVPFKPNGQMYLNKTAVA
jgi:hypothetical protein